MLQKTRTVSPPPTGSLEPPATGLSGNSGLDSQFIHTLTEMQRAMEADLRARLMRELESARLNMMTRFEETRREIERVSALLSEVNTELTTLLDDRDAELSQVLRKKSEESVLRSYLDGLTLSTGPDR